MTQSHPVVLNDSYVRACAAKFDVMAEALFARGHHALIGAVADEIPEATEDELEAGLALAQSAQRARLSYQDQPLAA